MTKKELISEFNKLSDMNDEVIGNLKAALDSSKEIRSLIEELPSEDDEIEDDKSDEPEDKE